MPTYYDPSSIEPSILKIWEELDFSSSVKKEQARSFSIPLPPPNITGVLHMGHAFQQTLMDILVRYHRMKGANVHWQGGVDHAGIATYLIVKRQLAARGIDAHQLSKEEFLTQILEWKTKSQATIFRQMHRLGFCIHPDQSRFTMDPAYLQAVRQAFVTLYRKGLIYRGLRLVNWDPSLQTAVSDLEVVSQPTSGEMHYLNYVEPQTQCCITVATTRPETIFGDVAIAVHPDDERYRHWIGKQVSVPLLDRTIPIVAHQKVDPTFGTGAVKLTPAHDFNDAKMAQQLKLPWVQVIDESGKIKETPLIFQEGVLQSGPGAFVIPDLFKGLDRAEARLKSLEALQRSGCLQRSEKVTIPLPICERSNTPIEPMLTWQWFLKASQLAPKAMGSVDSGAIEFIPSSYRTLFESWMRDLEDWCISRQLPWGHEIPAWWDAQGHHYVGLDEAEVRQYYGLPETVVLRQESDVLDTWFSSALWSFASLGWPEETEALKTYHPATLLITGFDILFFWVARMVMLSLELRQEIPFSQVYTTGLVRDEKGQKMSKSRGNVIDPLDLIEGIQLEALLEKQTASLFNPKEKSEVIKAVQKSFPEGIEAYGADALRATLASLANQGRDIHWSFPRLKGYRNFCNKLWNAHRLVMQLTTQEESQETDWKELTTSSLGDYPLSVWFESKFALFLEHYEGALNNYRFDQAMELLHEFFWHQFCDWYLEFSKRFCREGSYRASAQADLIFQFSRLLKVMHPILPFITDFLWNELRQIEANCLAKEAPTLLLLHDFPSIRRNLPKDTVDFEYLFNEFVAFIKSVREIKATGGIAPKAEVCLYLPGHFREKVLGFMVEKLLCPMGRISRIESLEGSEPSAGDSVQMKRLELELMGQRVLLELPKVDSVLEKRSASLSELEEELQKLEKLLQSPEFLAKAPKKVLELKKSQYEKKMQQKYILQNEFKRLKT